MNTTALNTDNSSLQTNIQELDITLVSPLGGNNPDGVQAANLFGTGWTYRHDWGNRKGPWKLTLNSASINCNSRVFVSASEFGGGEQCAFTGSARYTVHNVSPTNGSVTVWVNIEWDSPIRLRLDYLIVNP